MHIVHLYKDAFPPVIGGVERMIWWLSKRQVADGHRVTVLASQPDSKKYPPQPAEESIDGFSIVRMRSLMRPGGTPVTPGMTARLRSLEPDLIHLHHPNPASDVVFLLSGLKIPLVVTYHSDVVRQKLRYRAYRPVQQHVLRAAKVIMPTSHNYMESSEQLAPHRDKCKVVPLGVEPHIAPDVGNGFQARVDARRASWGGLPAVLFVGVLRYYKGLDFLIDAAAKLPEVAFVIVGCGPESDNLKRRVRNLGLGERVRFLGFVDDADLPEIYGATRFFCLPSHLRAEAFGLAMVEAMHAGLPAVTCDLPTGVTEVNEHEKTGLVVPRKDPEALAAAIDRLIRDEDLCRRLGENAREKAQREYTVERMYERVSAVYQQVMGDVSAE